jgi:hypothetical protein
MRQEQGHLMTARNEYTDHHYNRQSARAYFAEVRS